MYHKIGEHPNKDLVLIEKQVNVKPGDPNFRILATNCRRFFKNQWKCGEFSPKYIYFSQILTIFPCHR
jgi:hypothetical protein